MPTIELDGQPVTYTLSLNKRRKTIQLKVLPSAIVEIVAPSKLTKADLEHIFTAKRSWLKNKLTKLAALSANPVNQQLVSGAQLLYQGQPHTLTVLPSSTKPELTIQTGNLQVKLPEKYLVHPQSEVFLEQILKAWFVNQAGSLFQTKTKHWAAKIGVNPKQITIRDQKTRWGSCSSLGNINYNWRVIMAPPPVADYLVIHELCHLLVPNHSAKFWEQVRRFAPDYKNCRLWLTENGKLLSRLF